jgi:hypothetical protein
MEPKTPAYFDLKTVALLRETLDDAWSRLRIDQRATTSRTILAASLLEVAATGERDPERLINAALAPLDDRPKTDAA